MARFLWRLPAFLRQPVSYERACAILGERLEEEKQDGHRVLRLVVTELLWRDAGILHVERRAPAPLTGGKIIHLHARSRTGDTRGAPQ